jgi:hypothetical protein
MECMANSRHVEFLAVRRATLAGEGRISAGRQAAKAGIATLFAHDFSLFPR